MSTPRSTSRILEARGREQAAVFARLLAALAFARGVLRLDFATRQQAQQARARLVAVMEPLLDRAATETELLTVVVGAYGQALAAIDAEILSLKPLARVVTGQSQPACLLAWQLYSDTTRAAELVRLNNARCPEFMPVEILAPLPDDAA
jgi:prophage DNA circulation protein